MNLNDCDGCRRKEYRMKVCFFCMMGCIPQCPCIECLVKVMCKNKGECKIRNEVIQYERRLRRL